MALPSFMTQSITRVRAGTTTSRGSTIPDWDKATTATISGCTVQPAATSLSQDGRVLGISDGYTVYAPADAGIVEGDRIILADGNTYVINGEPRAWPSATGGIAHIQLNLVRWNG